MRRGSFTYEHYDYDGHPLYFGHRLPAEAVKLDKQMRRLENIRRAASSSQDEKKQATKDLDALKHQRWKILEPFKQTRNTGDFYRAHEKLPQYEGTTNDEAVKRAARTHIESDRRELEAIRSVARNEHNRAYLELSLLRNLERNFHTVGDLQGIKRTEQELSKAVRLEQEHRKLKQNLVYQRYYHRRKMFGLKDQSNPDWQKYRKLAEDADKKHIQASETGIPLADARQRVKALQGRIAALNKSRDREERVETELGLVQAEKELNRLERDAKQHGGDTGALHALSCLGHSECENQNSAATRRETALHTNLEQGARRRPHRRPKEARDRTNQIQQQLPWGPVPRDTVEFQPPFSPSLFQDKRSSRRQCPKLSPQNSRSSLLSNFSDMFKDERGTEEEAFKFGPMSPHHESGVEHSSWTQLPEDSHHLHSPQKSKPGHLSGQQRPLSPQTSESSLDSSFLDTFHKELDYQMLGT